MAFAYLTKAFYTVNRNIPMNILCKFGCTPYFNAILQQFHSGMSAQVVMAGSESFSFPVDVGVKQGCVLAPIILSLFLVAMTLVSHRILQPPLSVGAEYHHNGGLFNLRRLQAKTKTSSAVISALQYTDNAAIYSLTVDEFQRNLDLISKTYLRAGLIVNTTKTEGLLNRHQMSPLFPLTGSSE